MQDQWTQFKNPTIDFLLNKLVSELIEIPLPAEIGVRFAISACLRFACAAATKLGLTWDEILNEFELEWHSKQWDFGSGPGGGPLN